MMKKRTLPKMKLQLHGGEGIPNPDLINMKKEEIMQKMSEALKGGNEEDFAQAFTDFANDLQQSVINEAKLEAEGILQSVDRNVLTGRGVRQLTSEENNYYQKVISAMKSGDPKQGLADIDVVMPKTVIDDVFEDLTTNHPLLDAIDFQNSGMVTEWLLNANTAQLATWSPLCADIVKELTSGFKKIDLLQNKLSAFIPICKAMLDLGPVWLDRYVREVLSEALYLGLEDGILNGRGQTTDLHEPIGMRKDLTGSVVQATGYPDKTPVALNSLDPVAYGGILAPLATTENGNTRVVTNVILVVNPVDYLTKVMPATTPRATDGTYRHDVFPFPTTVIQSPRLAVGEAIMGLGKRYLMATGTGKSGKIEHSDHVRFLEDERVYLTKFYGHGQPKDNNSFILLDISNLVPTVQQVSVVGTVATKEVV